MRILLVDDHVLFREGVALLLGRLTEDLELIQAGSCEEALALPRNPAPDLVLLDIGLPGISGLEGIGLLLRHFGERPIVALSSADDSATIRQVIDAGAMGFIPKTASADAMIGALQIVLARGIYLPPAAFLGASPNQGQVVLPAPSRGIRPLDLGLTPRQTDVLYLVLQGHSIKSICRQVNLAESTVKTHVGAVLRALRVTTRTQAIVAAGRLGLRFDQAVTEA
ncbi:MAG: response regulator transcription factor [Sulfuritalea sp.]|nr:response regulator transcription factor [Sulfuritalea sp.]